VTSFSTLVPVYYYIWRQHSSISSNNHAHYILRLVRCFYICDVADVKSLYTTCLRTVSIDIQVHAKNNYKIRIWGNFERMHGL